MTKSNFIQEGYVRSFTVVISSQLHFLISRKSQLHNTAKVQQHQQLEPEGTRGRFALLNTLTKRVLSQRVKKADEL